MALSCVEAAVRRARAERVKWALADFALDLLVEYGLAVGTVVGYLRRASQAVAEWGGRRDLHWRANNAPLKRVLLGVPI